MRQRLMFGVVVLLLGLTGTVGAQPAAPEPDQDPRGEIYYVVEHRTTLYRTPARDEPYIELGLREPIYLQQAEGDWLEVRTEDGARGYVQADAVSNLWIRVSKRKKAVYVYRGTRLVKQYPADFGYNAFADKERRGSQTNPDDWRTPEGVFFVVRKNPHSKFYKAFVLNYPNEEDAERGIKQGLISQGEYEQIVRAARNFEMPPMYTALGGWIEIHGDGTGVSSNWTQGCVAVHNDHIDELWQWVHVGTPVLVER